MSKNKGFLIFSTAVIASGGLAYLYILKQNKKLLAQNAPDPALDIPANQYNPAIPAQADTSSPNGTGDFPLALGSKGPDVTALQKALGMSSDQQDGIFGPKTEAALLAVTRLKTVASQAAIDAISVKNVQNSADASRYALAESLFNSAMIEKNSPPNFSYSLMPNKNLQVYQSKKVLGDLFVHTNERLTSSPYDYADYVPYPTVSIVSVDKSGFMLMYDSKLKKYFYTSPYDWVISS